MKLLWTDLDERRASIVSALMIAVGPLSLALYTPALPALAEAFEAPASAVKLTLTLYFFGFCVAQLVCGPLSDAFGRRPVALSFFAVYLAGSAVALAAPTILVLQVGRALQGIGAAAGVATSRAMVRDLFVGQASARIMNRIGLMVALVPALSPTLGALLLASGHWRFIFAVMFLYALVLMAAMLALLPETNRSADPSLMRADRIARNYATLLTDRRFLVPAALMALVLGGLYTLPSVLPFVLIGKLGLSPLEYAAALLVQTAALLAANLLAGRLLRRVSALRLIPVGVAIIVTAGAGFAAIRLFDAPPVAAIIGPAALWIFGLPFVTPGAMTAALTFFPQMAGAASALVGFMQMGGGFLGSALAAAAFGDPLAAIDTLMPAISLFVGLVLFALPPAERPGRGEIE